MTSRRNRQGWKLAIALLGLAAMLQACASATVPAQPQNPSQNTAVTRG